jgi:hypothetical protein
MIEKRIKEYNELLNGEEEIIKELNKSGGLEKGYKIYYLLDNNWVEEFKNLIINRCFKQISNILNVSLIQRKREDKDFSYINKNFKLNLAYNFTLVTPQFMDLLCKNFSEKAQRELEDFYFNVIIGGKCFIIKYEKNKNENYALITLYNEKNKNFNNDIDYFFIIDNKEEFNKNIDYILRNNIFKNFLIHSK